MPRINQTKPDTLYCHYEREAIEYGETNDCAVKAVAAATNSSYADAWEALKNQGRAKGEATYRQQTAGALRALGYDYEAIGRDGMAKIIAQYPGVHSTLKNITTHHPERFNEVWANGETYLMFVDGHVLAIKDGDNCDWTKGRAKRALMLWRVFKK